MAAATVSTLARRCASSLPGAHSTVRHSRAAAAALLKEYSINLLKAFLLWLLPRQIFPVVTEKAFAPDEKCPRCQTPLSHIQYGYSGEVQANGKRIFPSNASVDARVPRRSGWRYIRGNIDIVSHHRP